MANLKRNIPLQFYVNEEESKMIRKISKNTCKQYLKM